MSKIKLQLLCKKRKQYRLVISDVKQSKLMSNLDRDIRQNSRCRCLQSMAFLKCLDTKQSIVKWPTVLSIFRQ